MPTVTADSYGIDATGATDVTTALTNAINAQPSGNIFQLHANGSYKSDSNLVWNAGITIDGQDAAIFQSVRRTGYPGPEKTVFPQGAGMVIRNLRLYGFRKDPYTGNKLVAVAGSPTIVGTTMVLDALNEEVRLPKVGLDWDIPPFVNQWMNHETPFYARDKDGYVRFEMSASDTTHVVGDAVLSIVDDLSGIPLSSQAFTLTSTPTTYQLAWLLPAIHLDKPFRITVRKATATANTITLASVTAYGEAGMRNRSASDYTGGDEFSAAVYPTGANFLMENCYMEGHDGDGVNMTFAGLNTTIRNCTVRANGRQGYTLEHSTGTLIEGCTAREIARSGVDLEPNDPSLTVVNPTIRDCTFINIRNAGIASGQTALVTNLNISNIISDRCGMGPWAGGSTGGTIVNWVHSNTYRTQADRTANGGTPGCDVQMYWRGLECDGFTTQYGFALISKSGGRDMHVRGARITEPTFQFSGGLGTADSGQVWRSEAGVWGVTGGKAYLTQAAGQSITTLDPGMANVDVGVDVTFAAAPSVGVVFRYQDYNNYLLFYAESPTTVQFYRKIAGTLSLVQTYTVANFASTTGRLRVRALGSALQFYLAGSLVGSLTDTTHQTQTRCGVYSNEITSRFDNFSVAAA